MRSPTAAVVALATVLCSSPALLTAPKPRQPSPDFVLNDAAEKPVRLSSFKGQVVLLDFWATWCTECKVEIPWFVEFDRKYKDQGLATIGVSLDDDGWKAVQPYADRMRMNYSIVLGTVDTVQRFRISALPITLLLDRQGRIADSSIGIVKRGSWEKEIQALLLEAAE